VRANKCEFEPARVARWVSGNETLPARMFGAALNSKCIGRIFNTADFQYSRFVLKELS